MAERDAEPFEVAAARQLVTTLRERIAVIEPAVAELERLRPALADAERNLAKAQRRAGLLAEGPAREPSPESDTGRLLDALRREERGSLGLLVQRTGVKPPTARTLLGRLVSDGFARRDGETYVAVGGE